MAPSAAGTWQTLALQVWETVVVPCECCGQVVAKRLWVVDVAGEERRFCGPECEVLYRDYVVDRGNR
jgi:hypothetical protein